MGTRESRVAKGNDVAARNYPLTFDLRIQSVRTYELTRANGTAGGTEFTYINPGH